MKIGILTFHWATNYGAVLQTYALQTFLESKGHEVVIINYKPRNYDNNFWTYIRNRKFLKHSLYKNELKKEAALSEFRRLHLHLTDRITKSANLSAVCKGFDCIISGSDQVLNPSFLLNGEGRNVSSSAYFLDFYFSGTKIGYAVSFGCTEYPKEALPVATKAIKNFNKIGVRESSGTDIVKSMGREDAVVMPDPTLLLAGKVYEELASESQLQTSIDYVYCFFIRNIADRKKRLSSFGTSIHQLWNNEDASYGLNDWLKKIQNARFVIADSFHCVVMCLQLHIPFAVVTELEGNVGMNDRLYTVLGGALNNHIVYKEQIQSIESMLNNKIDWRLVDEFILQQRDKALNFIEM